MVVGGQMILPNAARILFACRFKLTYESYRFLFLFPLHQRNEPSMQRHLCPHTSQGEAREQKVDGYIGLGSCIKLMPSPYPFYLCNDGGFFCEGIRIDIEQLNNKQCKIS